MKLTYTGKLLIGISVTAVIMTGCGGGGSSSDSNTPSASNSLPVVYTDSDLGLMWQDDTNAETTTKPWLTEDKYTACLKEVSGTSGTTKTVPSVCKDDSGDTAATFCKNMKLKGYTDWRLPTQDEMDHLLKSEQYKKLQNFIYGERYWTSSTYDNFYSATVFFVTSGSLSAIETFSHKNKFNYTRCIRDTK